MEDRYIKYDYDKDKYEKFKLKEEEIKHYDIFYTSSNIFKIGLKDKLTEEQSIDLFDNQKRRNYIIYKD